MSFWTAANMAPPVWVLHPIVRAASSSGVTAGAVITSPTNIDGRSRCGRNWQGITVSHSGRCRVADEVEARRIGWAGRGIREPLIGQAIHERLHAARVAVVNDKLLDPCLDQGETNRRAGPAGADQQRTGTFQLCAAFDLGLHERNTVDHLPMPAAVRITAHHIHRAKNVGARGRRRTQAIGSELVRNGHDQAIHVVRAAEAFDERGQVSRGHVKGNADRVHIPLGEALRDAGR